MVYQKYKKQLLIIGGLFFFAACEAPPAYVHVDEEFNRQSEFFLKGVTSRETVKVCYNKGGTTPLKMSVLAKNECDKFSKRAVFVEQNLRVCPLITPILAIYICKE